MGNLSHPSINRWGLNLFWYNFWYSDKNKDHNVHQDFFFNRLILIFINYGMFVEKDLFYSKYWYNKNSLFFKKRIDFLEKNEPISFRYVEYKNKVNSELALVKLRIKKKNIHLTKLWILRFQNWIVMNMYLIQPFKKEVFRKKNQQKDDRFFEIADLSTKAFSFISLVRLVLFFKYLNKFQQNKKNYYLF